MLDVMNLNVKLTRYKLNETWKKRVTYPKVKNAFFLTQGEFNIQFVGAFYTINKRAEINRYLR